MQELTREKPRLEPWWGVLRVAHGTSQLKRIGPLDLWLRRMRGEWQIARNPDPADETPEEAERFAIAGGSEEIELVPALADRPVVARPEVEFSVMPHQDCTLYVSTPLWIRLRTPGPDGVVLTEFPIQRPRDTWFGPNPMIGELCYASRTYCRIRREEIELHADRAITAVAIRNRADEPLLLQRLKLPVEYLSLYASDDGLWTQDIAFDREQDEPMSALSLRDKPRRPEEDELLVGPRRPPSSNLFVRAFTSIFANTGEGDE